MLKKVKLLWILAIFPSLFIPGVCWGDESVIFQPAVWPDALFLLDMSDSMKKAPDGGTCTVSTIDNPCSKVDIAKRAIRDVLDTDSNGAVVSPADDEAMGVRFGYMIFTGDADRAGILLKKPLGTPYSQIWTALAAENNSSGTPLVYGLEEAKNYLDSTPPPPQEWCRRRFVILLSDGMENKILCDGVKAPGYRRAYAVPRAAKALADAGYKVFVIIFGADFTAGDRNVLEWAAYYGGTDNPSAQNSGDPNAFSPTKDPCVATSSEDPSDFPLSGYAFTAMDTEQLKNTLRSAIQIMKAATYSFSVTSVVASRTTAENFLYEASFKTGAGGDAFWPGYLKKYGLAADGAPVLPPVWDAGSILKARDPATRNIFTYENGALVDFVAGSPGQKKAYLDVQTGELVQQVVGYIRGEAAYKPDLWKLGDIFHSSPILIGSPSVYFGDTRSPQAYIDFRAAKKDRERVIVLGANDGQFHAFRASDGSEKWSFIPPNLQPKLQYLALKTAPGHTYFVDGPVTVADVWLGPGDGTSKLSSDWHTLLVFGEGRGVRDQNNDPSNPKYLWSSSPYCDKDFGPAFTSSKYLYYCGFYFFNVTDTGAGRPAHPWPHGRINLTDSATQAPYLGEPWSAMAIGKVLVNGNEKWVGFMGGGYSPEATAGKGFFVVDLSSGNILWSYTRGNNSSMAYSIPASPTVVDTDNDGFIDTAYVGDLGGNMWRFKFCTRDDGAACAIGNWSGGLLFQSSPGFIQPIYTAAAVSRDSSSLWVFWGTGNREDVPETGGQDRFFALKDSDRSSTRGSIDLQNISAPRTLYNGVAAGWYIAFPASGEKILFDPTVFGGLALFSTYTPPVVASGDICGQSGGTSKLYAMAMMPIVIGAYTYDPGAGVLSPPPSGDPSDKTGGDRSVSLGAGMAKNPILSQKPLPTGGPTDLYISLSGSEGQDTRTLSNIQLGNNPLTQLLTQTGPLPQIIHWRDRRVR